MFNKRERRARRNPAQPNAMAGEGLWRSGKKWVSEDFSSLFSLFSNCLWLQLLHLTLSTLSLLFYYYYLKWDHVKSLCVVIVLLGAHREELWLGSLLTTTLPIEAEFFSNIGFTNNLVSASFLLWQEMCPNIEMIFSTLNKPWRFREKGHFYTRHWRVLQDNPANVAFVFFLKMFKLTQPIKRSI